MKSSSRSAVRAIIVVRVWYNGSVEIAVVVDDVC